MNAQWYYQMMGETLGPVTAAELKRMAAQGQLSPATLVREGADGRWVPANAARVLFPASGDGKGAGSDKDVGDQPVASRYPALRIIATVYRIMAGLVLGSGVVSFVLSLGACTADEEVRVAAPCAFFIWGIGLSLAGVSLLGMAELITLLIDIEKNTRAVLERGVNQEGEVAD